MACYVRGCAAVRARRAIVTENWSLPKTPGRIDPNNFAPYPKNPLIAQFFVNIGRADVLGSGVRNLYQYTKIYSGGEPELIDGDIFRTIVPLGLSVNGMNDNGILNNKMNDNLNDNGIVNDKPNDSGVVNDKLNDNENNNRILVYISSIQGAISTAQAAQIIGCSHSTARRVLLRLVADGVLVPSGANKNKVYSLKGDV